MSEHELRGRLAGIHEEMPDWVDAFLERRGFAWQQFERGELYGRRGFPFRDLSELQQYLILSDPVRFAECVFVEHEEEGSPPWRLWDYQKASLRWYTGNTIHQCGFEVGKTRRLIVLHVWEAITQRGKSLIGAALDGHLQLIYEEIAAQAENNPWLNAQIHWGKSRVKPYRDLHFTGGSIIHFRPAAVDGSAFRGAHVNRRISMDEAPKVPSREAWNNFFSRRKPKARVDLYGVPDGRRDTKWFELCARFEEVDPLRPPPPPAGEDDETSAVNDPDTLYYCKFRWSKRLQPEPFWSERREQQYVIEFGGYDSSDFQQQVEGHHGDPAETVFPWHQLSRCLRYAPETVIVKLLIEGRSRQLFVDGARLNPAYQVKAAIGDEGGEVGADPLLHFHHEVLPAPVFDADAKREGVEFWAALLRPLIGSMSATNGLCVGVDFGASDEEPTEILVGQPLGGLTRILLRVQVKRFTYDQQEELIRALNRLLRPAFGWGWDATGSGATVQHYLTRDLGLESVDHSGFVMNATTIHLDAETGEPLRDPLNPDKHLKVSFLELGTQLLEARVQRGTWEMPYDPDIVLEWANHTASKGSDGKRRFKKSKDHTVTAGRSLVLRLYALRVGELGTPPLEFAVPPGSRRASFALQEDF